MKVKEKIESEPGFLFGNWERGVWLPFVNILQNVTLRAPGLQFLIPECPFPFYKTHPEPLKELSFLEDII